MIKTCSIDAQRTPTGARSRARTATLVVAVIFAKGPKFKVIYTLVLWLIVRCVLNTQYMSREHISLLLYLQLRRGGQASL